jgi:hypothetical protein
MRLLYLRRDVVDVRRSSPNFFVFEARFSF